MVKSAYREATRAAIADMIIGESRLDDVRVKAGNEYMTLRQASVWMTDYLFPPDPHWDNLSDKVTGTGERT